MAAVKKLDITVKLKIFSLSDLRNESVRITVSVLDKSNNKPVSQAFIAAILPSGIESYRAKPTEDGYELLNWPSVSLSNSIALIADNCGNKACYVQQATVRP